MLDVLAFDNSIFFNRFVAFFVIKDEFEDGCPHQSQAASHTLFTEVFLRRHLTESCLINLHQSAANNGAG